MVRSYIPMAFQSLDSLVLLKTIEDESNSVAFENSKDSTRCGSAVSEVTLAIINISYSEALASYLFKGKP